MLATIREQEAFASAIDAAENGLAYHGATQIEMSADRCARLADMEIDESPSACGPAMLAGLSSQNDKTEGPAA